MKYIYIHHLYLFIIILLLFISYECTHYVKKGKPCTAMQSIGPYTKYISNYCKIDGSPLFTCAHTHLMGKTCKACKAYNS